jgi:hypothetical protein
MRKSSIALLVALLVAAVVLSAVGCGSKKSSSSAEGILEKSQKALLNAKSAKVNGSITVKTPGAEEKQSKDTFTGEFNNLGGGDVEGHIVSQDQDGRQSEAYLQGGYIYTYKPTTGWQKQKMEGATGSTASMLDPENLSAMIKYAENLEKLTGQGKNYVISFDVGDKFYQKMLSGLEKASSAPGTAEQSMAQQYSDLIKSMVGDIHVSVVMKIDKTTFYPSELTVKASAKDIPMMGDVSMASDMTFSDYDVPVTVSLPPEAANAKEVESRLSGGIPGMPGLGF